MGIYICVPTAKKPLRFSLIKDPYLFGYPRGSNIPKEIHHTSTAGCQLRTNASFDS